MKRLFDKNGLGISVGDVVEYQSRLFTVYMLIEKYDALIFNEAILNSQPIPASKVTLVSRNKFMSNK